MAEKPKTALSKVARRKAAKAKKAAAAGAARNQALDPDSVWDSALEDVSKGTGVLRTSKESEQLLIGLPLPALCLRILFGQDVLTLSRSLMLYGFYGCGKSALLFELFRWVMLHKGLAAHIENENKDPPDLRNSIFRHDPLFINKRLRYKETNAQEEWMEFVNVMLKVMEKRFTRNIERKRAKKNKYESAAEHKERTGPKVNKDAIGWLYPLIIGVDSLTSTSSVESIDKIRNDGAPGRTFAVEANILNQFAKTMPTLMRGRPLLMVFTSHLKKKQDDMGNVQDHVPGGEAMRFMDTTEIKLQRINRLKTVEYGGMRVRITLSKNSLGETGNSIEATLKWWFEHDPETGAPIQQTVWDWDSASIQMLLSLQGKLRRQVDDLAELKEVKSSKGQKVWCKELGIPEKSPVIFAEAGQRLEANHDLIRQIQNVLCIRPRVRFTPGEDYQDLTRQVQLSAERYTPVYVPVDLSDQAFIDTQLEKRGKRGEGPDKPKRKLPPPPDEDTDD